MADVKQYITHAEEGGNVMISEDVVSTIVENTLTEIDGVGEKKAKALMKTFKTVTAVKNASVDELCRAEGINKVIAEKIYNHFHKNLTI